MSEEMKWVVEEVDRLREQNATLCAFIKEIYAMRGEDDVIRGLCNKALEECEEC